MDLRQHADFSVFVGWLHQAVDKATLMELVERAEQTCLEIEADPKVDPSRRDYETLEDRIYFQERWQLLNTLKGFADTAKVN